MEREAIKVEVYGSGYVRLEEKEGRKVWTGKNKVMIDGEWWFWDEEEEKLKDRLGKRCTGILGSGEGAEKV